MIKIVFTLISFFFLFSTAVNASSVEIPVYGNWCGPGYPAIGETPKPIDSVDEACMLHDNMYVECEQDENRLMCEAEADFDLVDSLHKDINSFTREQLVVADSIGKYFSVQAPIKATVKHQQTIFTDRLKVATILTDKASSALSDVGSKLKSLGEGFVGTTEATADEVTHVVTEIKNKIEKEP